MLKCWAYFSGNLFFPFLRNLGMVVRSDRSQDLRITRAFHFDALSLPNWWHISCVRFSDAARTACNEEHGIPSTANGFAGNGSLIHLIPLDRLLCMVCIHLPLHAKHFAWRDCAPGMATSQGWSAHDPAIESVKFAQICWKSAIHAISHPIVLVRHLRDCYRWDRWNGVSSCDGRVNHSYGSTGSYGRSKCASNSENTISKVLYRRRFDRSSSPPSCTRFFPSARGMGAKDSRLARAEPSGPLLRLCFWGHRHLIRRAEYLIDPRGICLGEWTTAARGVSRHGWASSLRP